MGKGRVSDRFGDDDEKARGERELTFRPRFTATITPPWIDLRESRPTKLEVL